MAATSLLVGSIRLEAATIEVNGVAVNLAAGRYYLRHPSSSLSLVDVWQQALQSIVGAATVVVTQGLRVRQATTAGNPVAVDWLDATAWRDALGYAGDLASSESPHQADYQSALLWSPGWIATPETLLGTAGWVETDATHHVSADGTTMLVTTYYEQVRQALSWTEIEAHRMRVPAGQNAGGTFHELHEQSLKRGYSFRWYVEQNEVAGSTTAMSWDDTADNSFGPYVLLEPNARYYARVIANADLYSPLELGPLAQVTEY